jgi:hypothetical protein
MSSHKDYDSPPPSQSTDCNKLSINAQIASPVPAVVAKLTVGDILDVTLVSARGPVQLVTKGGEVAGALLPIEITTLIQCMSDGHEYTARVIEIKGGNYQVLIKHV